VGIANAIDLVNPPSIQTSISGGSLAVKWPAAPEGFVLEMTDDFISGSWTPAPGSPTVYNGWNSQTVPLNGSNQFFRLRFLGP
jgi:hypothetical protein